MIYVHFGDGGFSESETAADEKEPTGEKANRTWDEASRRCRKWQRKKAPPNASSSDDCN